MNDNKGEVQLPWLEHPLDSPFWMVLIFAVTMWLATAFAAFVVAPRDRPWSFFWCTLLLLGPLRIALALVAHARPKPEVAVN
ncbi:hypothetical protein [Mycolicibacterium llatzerense]|uniref:Transmembrane protein n=1 Tax=Mycolicibacterium llatzerense TaxID=280871 RepID=A0A0D1LG61_9MYCO|nr:hypothetical protein [Mycolicibacterium llatzerense]KIU17472.1 hypothetical protein TL10_07460 [Mycolicibacterium llatzerense]